MNMAKKKEPLVVIETPSITAYKGFGPDWKCRDFQYEIGKTYLHDGDVKKCESGFHACENPLDIFNYYEPTSKFAAVKMGGKISRETDGDSKIASGSITIEAEISIPTIVTKAIEWITALCVKDDEKHATGYQSASSATGDQSASSATGYQSASNATGYRSASSATGYRSASSATGKNSVALNIGLFGKSKAGKDGAIVVCAHDESGNILHIRASKVGENGIKPDVFYALNQSGEFIESE
jgi:hypothetical protein